LRQLLSQLASGEVAPEEFYARVRELAEGQSSDDLKAVVDQVLALLHKESRA
jgi:hypothetical protein